jgi:hypothetical protein
VRVRSLAGAIAACAVLVAPADAHEGNPNYRSEVTRVDPQIPGLEVEVVNLDDSLEVRNETGETVIVLGYDGEPYVRIEPGGRVEVNLNSASFYVNQDRFGESPVPPSVDEQAPPRWRLANESGTYSWHDHRIHYMSQGTPAQVEDTAERTKVFDYRVPLRVGDQPVEVLGSLYWVGRDEGLPWAPFAALAAAALLAVAAVFAIRRRRSVRDREPDEPKEAW